MLLVLYAFAAFTDLESEKLTSKFLLMWNKKEEEQSKPLLKLVDSHMALYFA